MVGNPSAGMSTLTKALKSVLTHFIRLFTHSKPVSGVDEKTAGIVPHEFESKIYGCATLYDFAGQRELYGRLVAMLLCYRIPSRHPPPFSFSCYVDLSKNADNTKQNILYCMAVIHYFVTMDKLYIQNFPTFLIFYMWLKKCMPWDQADHPCLKQQLKRVVHTHVKTVKYIVLL